MQSLSEITSPKALDEKRPVSGRGCLIYREVGERRHARSRAASRKAAAGLHAVHGPLARFILCPPLCKLSISAFRSISTTMRERSARCQKIVDAGKDSLECGSPAAAFAETALLSGSSWDGCSFGGSDFSPDPAVGEQSKLAAGLLRGKRQQGCRSPRAFGLDRILA